MVFRGRYPRSLDPKGRLTLPPEFRDALASQGAGSAAADGASSSASGASFVLTTYDGCLVAFSWNDWVELEEKFMRIPNPSPKVRAFRRLVIGGAETHTPDAHGRILLSPDHRAYAGLDREATILGLVDRFEIWNPAALRASMSSENLEGVTEELAASGIDFSL
ncbi:division/cell wall cluster transcriptional repressor MraZ [uncultured Mailhella sp.]|uniref:division/cell wall cluster transcriptional repressor MraZ n=1 Tax=uncultured Mailhella sp. TaxID=1981031 RepID=UPI0032087318